MISLNRKEITYIVVIVGEGWNLRIVAVVAKGLVLIEGHIPGIHS